MKYFSCRNSKSYNVAKTFWFKVIIKERESSIVCLFFILKISMIQPVKLLFITLLCLGITQLNAQVFRAGFVGGINIKKQKSTELSNFEGLKFGLNTGLVIKGKIAKRLAVSTEMLFTQPGSYIEPESYPNFALSTLWLNYIEVPVYLSFLRNEVDGYYRNHYSIGVSYARLVHVHAISPAEDFSSQIIWDNKSTIIGHLTIAHYFNHNVGFDLRLSATKNSKSWTFPASLRGIYLL